MKALLQLCVLTSLIAVAGCSTPKSVANLRGQGTKRMFDARYETVWSAAKGAAQYHDLDILDADKATGFISARRRMNETTFGENVCIWIREVAPAQTEVEVVGRRSGPPVLDRGDWELRIQRTISTILSI